LPGFSFKQLPGGKLPKLPAVKVPFGLDLTGTALSDNNLKELRGFNSLNLLILSQTKNHE
jgi:hypothetical protein